VTDVIAYIVLGGMALVALSWLATVVFETVDLIRSTDRPLHRVAPWLILIPGYVLGVAAILDYWPEGEDPPILVGWGLLVWAVGYPFALSTVLERARREERERIRAEASRIADADLA
jgi:hypothetical protein